MSKLRTIGIPLVGEQKTREFARQMLAALYRPDVTMLLEGDLGTGKTTFVQGLASAMGIVDNVGSPTYALEQRYGPSSCHLQHIDLYRLSTLQADTFLSSLDGPDGLRCIEWASRASAASIAALGKRIEVHFADAGRAARGAAVTFLDVDVPADALIDEWREMVGLPDHIRAHCDAVGEYSSQVAQHLADHGQLVRVDAVRAAGRLHDLLRFIDFRNHAHPQQQYEERWGTWLQRFAGMRHEAAAAAFLREQRFDEIACMVETHGMNTILVPTKLEQLIVLYADKRFIDDRKVTIDERFSDFGHRYGNGTMSEEQRTTLEAVRTIEQQLFPDGMVI